MYCEIDGTRVDSECIKAMHFTMNDSTGTQMVILLRSIMILRPMPALHHKEGVSVSIHSVGIALRAS